MPQHRGRGDDTIGKVQESRPEVRPPAPTEIRYSSIHNPRAGGGAGQGSVSKTKESPGLTS